MALERQVRSDVESYVRSHEVFTLEDLAKALNHPGGKSAARNSLRYHLRLEHVKSVTRGVYVSVPSGADPKRFQPDRYLVAAAIREDANSSITRRSSSWARPIRTGMSVPCPPSGGIQQ